MMQTKDSKKIKRKRMMLLLPILGLLILVVWRSSNKGGGSAGAEADSEEPARIESITRNEWGEGNLEENMKISIPELSTECSMNLSIPERKYSEEEKETYLAEAKKEIKNSFYHDSEQAERVYSNVNPRDTYQDQRVEAQWSFDPYEYITSAGELRQDRLDEEGTLINASVSLSCGDAEQIYEFAFHVYPGPLTVEEMIQRDISRQINAQDKSMKEVKLPLTANGYRLVWKAEKEPVWIKSIFAGIICCGALLIWKKEKAKDEAEKKKRQMAMDYPDFVSKLSLLLGAGMTISAALKKMDKAYQKQQKTHKKAKREVYEELSITMHEIENGMGEYKAFTDFGERCGIWQYRRFSSLLIQSQRMGNRNLIQQLNDEAKQAFTERKNMAKKLGEEAGTKLLFPMMLMMLLIMGLILVPAYLSIQI